jgi:hypothetical protein
MKVALFFCSTLLVSSMTFAQSGQSDADSKVDSSARASINQDEIKRAHSRLLAAEAKLKKELTSSDSNTSENNSVKNAIASTDLSPKAKSTSIRTESSNDTALKSEIASLQRKVKALESERNSLLKEVNGSRNRLLVAETEVERLQGIIDNKSRNIMTPISLTAPAVNKSEVKPLEEVTPENPLLSVAQEQKASADMPIVTITARKANLRIGPRETDSPLMEVAYGTRLVVETRIGEWYRVIAPTGVRAWVSAKVVAFGDTASTGPTRVAKIAGFDKGVEDEAFGLISSLSN